MCAALAAPRQRTEVGCCAHQSGSGPGGGAGRGGAGRGGAVLCGLACSVLKRSQDGPGTMNVTRPLVSSHLTFLVPTLRG